MVSQLTYNAALLALGVAAAAAWVSPASAQTPLRITPQAQAPKTAVPKVRPKPPRTVQKKKPPTRAQSSERRARSAAAPVSRTPARVAAPNRTGSVAPVQGATERSPGRSGNSPATMPFPLRQGEPDVAFGALQRGHYLTAFAEATRRVEQTGDPKAMTLLGELYANGLGVVRDEKKAAEWYALAAARGDREAMFTLSMFRLAGRGGPRDRDAALVLLAQAANLGHVAAAYNLGLLQIDGTRGEPDLARAAELFRKAADANNAEAQYALATLYKEGRGVPKDLAEATRLLGAAAKNGNTDAEVEYAIALFNGDGVVKDETAGAAFLQKAARKGSPIAQNRLARALAGGRGVAVDPVEAAKWHIVARTRGETDLWLEAFLQKLTPEQRQAGENSAKAWLDSVPASKT